MSTVYTVWSGSYSDRGMHAVFSTEEAANSYVYEYNQTESARYEPASVEPYEVDADQGKICRQYWVCCIDKDGNDLPEWKARGKELGPPHIPGRAARYANGFSNKFQGCSYDSEEHAHKLAVEARQEWLREQTIPAIKEIP